jgi:hypothetical protein
VPDRFSRIEEIYRRALEQEQRGRAEFVARACGHDDDLRRADEARLTQGAATVSLRFFDYARHAAVDVAPRSATGAMAALTVSPDGRELLYAQQAEPGVDLALIVSADRLAVSG